MGQEIENIENNIANQLNINENTGSIFLSRKTRFSRRFEKLNLEVASDERYGEVMDDFKYYNTVLDGVDMPTKLADGGFTEHEIFIATIRKDKYAKKLEKNIFFESAQWIG